jgi:hypothetical protein
VSDDSLNIGIDVAKATLDVAIRPGGQHWQIPNTDDGIPWPVLETIANPKLRLIVREYVRVRVKNGIVAD